MTHTIGGRMRGIALAFITSVGLSGLPALAQDDAEAGDGGAAAETSEGQAAGDNQGQDSGAAAAEERSPDTVLATVDGEDITEGDLSFAAEDLAQDMQNIPAGQRRSFLLGVLVDMKVLANAAEEEGLGETEVFQRRLDYLRDRALRRAYFSTNIVTGIDEEAVRSEYDRIAAEMEGEDQIRARHVLVETEEEAQQAIAEIEGGRSFEEVAQEMSTGPSAPNGGDLGFFSRGQMVAPFEEVAFDMEAGDISEPVETEFGWHVIKLEERRPASPPPFEEIASQLQQQLLVQRFETAVSDLKEGAEIEILAEDLQPQQAPAQGAMPEGAAPGDAAPEEVTPEAAE